MIEKLRHAIAELQAAIEAEIEQQRRNFRYSLERRKVIFERDVMAEHRKLRQSLIDYFRTSRILFFLTSPFIYGVVIPLVLVDISATIFQAVCFPLYGIPRVRHCDHMIFDRHYLGYLNVIQKFNCMYCEYANGVISYVREIASRTEQFWCPIKHASKVKDPHQRYFDFIEYGDSQDFKDKWAKQREKCRACEKPCDE